MVKSQIGNNAGLVWDALTENGAMTVADLKKKAKVKDPNLSYALGWLAREEKIRFTESEGVVTIELV